MMAVEPTGSCVDLCSDDAGVAGAGWIDEWLFAAWTGDATLGLLSGHRVMGGRAWYWSALAQAGSPLLHLTEWDVAVRADPFVVKAPEMWAEHHCVDPLQQWSIGNEAYFVVLDDPTEALGRGYGVPTPTAMDLEWYATAVASPIGFGFEQTGNVHGRIDIAGRPPVDLVEVPAHRWRRRTDASTLAPVPNTSVVAHTALRAPFGFPDGTLVDWVVTPNGWRSRRRR
jgi:hypothetical protein